MTILDLGTSVGALVAVAVGTVSSQYTSFLSFVVKARSVIAVKPIA